jgi:hypothetical protein
MRPRWMIEVKNHIGADDQIKETCESQLHGESGQLVLTTKRLLYVREEGLLRKKILFSLELPYHRIKRVVSEGSVKLNIYDVNEIRHTFIVMDTPAPKLESRLKEYMKRPQTQKVLA